MGTTLYDEYQREQGREPTAQDSLYQQYLAEQRQRPTQPASPEESLYDQYRRETGKGSTTAPVAAPDATPDARRAPLDIAGTAASVRRAKMPGFRSDATTAAPQYDNLTNPAIPESERQREAEAGRAPLPVRVAQNVGEFGVQAVEHPIETAKGIILAPIESAKRTFLSPVVGSRISEERGFRGNVPSMFPRDEKVVTKETPGAITPKEFYASAAQTGANALAGPLSEGATALADRAIGGLLERELAGQGIVDIGEATAQREAGRRAAQVIGGAAGAAPIGAAYDPEHPVEGAATFATIGTLLHPLHDAVQPVAERVGRGVRDIAQDVGERARAARAARRAGISPVDISPVENSAPPAEAQAPTPPEQPAPPSPAAAEESPTLRRRIAESIDPTISAQIREAEANAVTGLPGRAPFNRALQSIAGDPKYRVVRFDVNGTKSINDALGHPYTDEHVLQGASAALTRAAADVGVPERVFHLSGDEFAAIVPAEHADAFRQRAQELYGVREHGQGLKSSLSGGVGATEAEADAASYRQKAIDKAAQGIVGREGSATVRTVPLSEIDVEPERFQFKQDVNPETGAGKELKGVDTFNPDLAGVVSVWRDPADGRLKIVNGHHRYELAKRTGQPTLDVREIQAPTAEAARAKGALINIAEGRGTPIDAAKLIRDTGFTADEFARTGVSMRGALASKGFALSRLDPALFERVARGEVPEDIGVAVGKVLERPEQQRAAIELIQRSGKRLTPAEAENVARQVRDAGSESISQETLFGTEETALSLAVDRARLAEAVKKDLARDKRLFGFVSKEGRAEELQRGGNVIDAEQSARLAEQSANASEIFDRLASRSGPVGDILTEGARRLAHGEKLAAIKDDIAPRLRAAVSDALAGGETGRAGAGGGHVPEGSAPVDEGRSATAAEAAGAEEGAVAPPNPDQSAFFAPMNLFGEEEPSGAPTQGSLFGAKEGTEQSRNLSQTEAAARAELPKLREQLRLETDPARRASINGRIAKLERLVNRGEKISATEMSARAASEQEPPPPQEPGQIALLAPAVEDTPLAPTLRKALGLAKSDVSEVKALVTIGRNLADAVGVPLRQGRFRAAFMRARGVFFPRSEVTRVVRLDMLDTVSHEIGHYISKKYLGNPTMKVPRGNAIALTGEERAELQQMGKNLYGDRKPAAGYGEEGIAEWFSFYVTEPDRILEEAPRFTARMQQVLRQREPFLLAALDQARDDFERYQKAPANARIASMVSVNERARWSPSVKGMISAWFDDVHEFKVAEREIAAAGGASTPREATKSAYTLARLSRGSAGMAEEMVERGIASPTDPAAPRRSMGLEQILDMVKPGRIGAFREYVTAERVLEKAAQGIDTGFKVRDAQAVAKAGEKEFGDAAKALWQYSRALVEYRRDAGLLTAQEAAQILEKNQKRVPFYRMFDESETGSGRGSGKKYARNSSGLMRMKGSARPIIDPLESLISDTYAAARAVQMHRVAAALVKMADQTEGSGRVIERLIERPVRPINLPIAKVADQLQDLGFTIPEDITDEQLQRMAEGVLTGFEELRSGGPNESKDLVIPMLRGGKREWYAVRDRALFDALQGLGTEQMPTWLRMLSIPARTLRAGATLTAEFIGRNPVRDAWSAAIYSEAHFRPPGWDFAKGLFHALKQDDAYQRWRLAGGDNAAMLGLDRPQVQKHLRDLTRSRTALSHARDVVLHPIDTLRLLSSLGENATRLGEFAAVEQRARREGARPAEAATRAGIASRDVTLDFARAGTQGKMVNQIVAFFNASLQGSAKLVHELKTRPHVIIPRAVAAITVPSIALYLMNRHDPAYQELPEWEKDTFWIVPQRDASGALVHLWRIPKPFELGVLFGTVPERIMRWMDSHDPHAFDELGNRFAQTFSPISWPLTGSALAPLVENWANKDAFTDRPIVPASTQELLPPEQAAPHTGEFARQVGRLTKSSPAKVEHLVTGYTAGLGRIALGAADAATREGRKVAGLPPLESPLQRRESDALVGVPGVRGFVARPPGVDAQSISDFYDAFARAEATRQTWRAKLKAHRVEDARSFFKAHRDEIASVATGSSPGRLRAAKTKMDELQQALRAAERGAPTAARAAAVRRIQDEMIQLARIALRRPRLSGSITGSARTTSATVTRSATP